VRKRKQPKAKRGAAEVLLRDMQATAAKKLALFKTLKARGGFADEDRTELLKVARMLRVCRNGEVITVSGTLKAGHFALRTRGYVLKSR
jgi:hypothetical protein